MNVPELINILLQGITIHQCQRIVVLVTSNIWNDQYGMDNRFQIMVAKEGRNTQMTSNSKCNTMSFTSSHQSSLTSDVYSCLMYKVCHQSLDANVLVHLAQIT